MKNTFLYKSTFCPFTVTLNPSLSNLDIGPALPRPEKGLRTGQKPSLWTKDQPDFGPISRKQQRSWAALVTKMEHIIEERAFWLNFRAKGRPGPALLRKVHFGSPGATVFYLIIIQVVQKHGGNCIALTNWWERIFVADKQVHQIFWIIGDGWNKHKLKPAMSHRHCRVRSFLASQIFFSSTIQCFTCRWKPS